MQQRELDNDAQYDTKQNEWSACRRLSGPQRGLQAAHQRTALWRRAVNGNLWKEREGYKGYGLMRD